MHARRLTALLLVVTTASCAASQDRVASRGNQTSAGREAKPLYVAVCEHPHEPPLVYDDVVGWRHLRRALLIVRSSGAERIFPDKTFHCEIRHRGAPTEAAADVE